MNTYEEAKGEWTTVLLSIDKPNTKSKETWFSS